MSNTRFILTLLLFPLLLISLLGWLIYWKFWGKNQAKQAHQRKKQVKNLLAHIRNFSPTRLKNRTWQKSTAKYKKKRKKPTKTIKNK